MLILDIFVFLILCWPYAAFTQCTYHGDFSRRKGKRDFWTDFWTLRRELLVNSKRTIAVLLKSANKPSNSTWWDRRHGNLWLQSCDTVTFPNWAVKNGVRGESVELNFNDDTLASRIFVLPSAVICLTIERDLIWTQTRVIDLIFASDFTSGRTSPQPKSRFLLKAKLAFYWFVPVSKNLRFRNSFGFRWIPVAAECFRSVTDCHVYTGEGGLENCRNYKDLRFRIMVGTRSIRPQCRLQYAKF